MTISSMLKLALSSDTDDAVSRVNMIGLLVASINHNLADFPAGY